MEGEAGRARILRDLEQAESFRMALDAVTQIYGNTEDDTIVVMLARQIATRQAPEELDRLARALIAVGGERAIAVVREVCPRIPEQQRNALLAMIDRKPPVETVQDLVSTGVISVEKPEEFLQEVIKWRAQEYGEDTDEPIGVMEILHVAGIALSFDVETGTIPVRHDELLRDFAKSSGGVFAPEGCHEKMLQKDEEDWESPYRVQFVHGERLYRFTAQNFGDWYDVERLVFAINRALSDSQAPQRFFQAAGDGQVATFICVTPDQAQVLSRRFHMAWDENWGAAMEDGKAYEEDVLRRMKEDEEP